MIMIEGKNVNPGTLNWFVPYYVNQFFGWFVLPCISNSNRMTQSVCSRMDWTIKSSYFQKIHVTCNSRTLVNPTRSYSLHSERAVGIWMGILPLLILAQMPLLEGETWAGQRGAVHLVGPVLSFTVLVRTSHWWTQTPAIGKYVLHQWALAYFWTLGADCSPQALRAKIFFFLFLDSWHTHRRDSVIHIKLACVILTYETSKK